MKINRLNKRKKVISKIKGTTVRPRLSVFRSNQAIYAQIIDDDHQKTLVAASEKEIKRSDLKVTKIEKAKLVGEVLAQKALKIGIKKVLFDRRRYRYHGRVRALAGGARREGLEF